MTPNRTAPAYQEYAASMMARLEYRTLTLPQRGLLYSMRLECPYRFKTDQVYRLNFDQGR